MLIVDQFQHWLYENPSHTSEERNEKYLQLQKLISLTSYILMATKIG